MNKLAFSLVCLGIVPGFSATKEGSLPLFFVQNAGITDASIRYIVETSEMRAAFASDVATFQIHGEQVQMRFEGADRGASLEGIEPLAAKANFFLGQDPREWHTGVPTFQKILYRNLYPGIDLTYAGTKGRVKSEFTVAPGADPRLIRLEYSGTLSIAANGDLIAPGSESELRERAPEIFQETTAGRVQVAGHYRLVNAHTAGFEVDSYDASLPLVIDPVISYSTYLGGTGISAVTGVAVDSGGDLYVTGWTEALNFPIVGAMQAVNRGGVDAFVAKFNPAGTALLYATYIGGGGDDRGAAIAVDSSGQAYVTGSTASANFPLAAAIRAGLAGSRTAFVLKLNAVGNTLLYSTYMGGSKWDTGNAIAVDGAGYAYIAGDTQSADFPVLNAVQSAIGGGMDAFFTKLTPAGGLSVSTYLGGAGDEHAGGVAVDGSGNVYLAGGTYSTNFPVVAPIQGVNGGSQDAFVTKINPAGNSILYSTYLGGNGTGSSEQANAIAVDSSGNAYVTGVTNSSNFPVTSGAYQTAYSGMQDAFITKFNAAGNTLLYSTYLGGTSFDWATGIGLDSGGNAYVAGYTSSGDFATVNGVQGAFGGMYDAFVTELNATGNGVGFSTYFGGSGSDVANGIAVDGSGNIFVGGQTSSLNLPLQGPIQSSNNGGSTGWAARLGVTAPPPQVPSTVSVTPSSGSGNSVTLTAQYSDSGGAAALTTVSLLLNTSASTTNACYISYNAATNAISLANDSPSSGSTTVIPGGGSQQNSQCVVNGVGTSRSISGSALTLTVSLTFQPGFGGGKTTYLYAADAGGNTGWISRGAWTVTIPPPQPSVDSVAPNAGLGASQTFTFVFSDTQNATNLTGMAMLFTGNASVTNACYIAYDRNQGTVALAWDSVLGSDSKPLSSTVVLNNSQCSVGAASAAFSGLSNIVTVAVTFKGAFSGVKSIFMFAAEASSNTGWVQKGTYTIAAGGVPVASSVIPNSGSGPGQRFSFTISDQGGAGFLSGLEVLFSSSLSTTNACVLVYDRTTNQVSLSYDNPANGAAAVTPGSTTVVSNSQCTVRGANTTVVIGTLSVVVTLDLSFNASWFGAKNVYLLAAESGVNTGLVTVGSWTVTGGSPTADSVTPSSGSGASPSYTFTVSDSASALNLVGISALITAGAPSSIANACYVVYNRGNATIGLYDNSGTTLTTKPIGSAAGLQNSQCAVGYSGMTTSGNSMSLLLNLVLFSPAFSGAKTVYLQANEPNTSSGWVSRGTWTVP
jgi:hypothetical protein